MPSPASASKPNNAASTPFGIAPGVLLAYYLFVCTLTGNISASVEPLKDLMRHADIFAESGQQETLLVGSTTLGTSVAILAAIAAGILNDVAGPLAAAAIGQICSVVGIALMFFSPPENYLLISLGNAILGATYACVSISHTSIAACFPGRAALAITVLCVGNDLSLAIPNVLLKIAERIGSVRMVILGYCAICGGILVLEFFLVPMRPFSPPATATLEDEETTEIKNKSTDATKTYDSVQKEKKASTTALNMKDWPTNKQLSHRVYWIITAFICWAFFRKCYYSQLVGAINVAVANVNAGLSPNAVNPEAVAKATRVTHGFKHLLPFGFVGSIVTGALTNKFGVVFGLIIVNAWATILFGLTSIGVLALQWPAIMFFNLFQGFIFGMMYAYLGAFFGFASLGTLQGCIKIFTGGLGLLFTPFYKHVMPLFPDVLWANRVLFIGSCLAFLLPLWLIVSPPEEEVIPSTETVETGATLRRSTMPMRAVGGPQSCFAAPMLGADLDRTSMMVIAKEARDTRSRLNARA